MLPTSGSRKDKCRVTGQTMWIQGLCSQLGGHRKLIYMTNVPSPDRAKLKISDIMKDDLIDGKK